MKKDIIGFTLFTLLLTAAMHYGLTSYTNISLAERFREKGKYEKSLRYYNRAIERHSNSYDLIFSRACVYDKLKLHEKALEDYTRAIEIKPHDGKGYLLRGGEYFALKRYKEAIADYSTGIELVPDYIYTYYMRGLIYKILKENRKAISDMNKFIKLDGSDPDAYRVRANAYSELSKETSDPKLERLANRDMAKYRELTNKK